MFALLKFARTCKMRSCVGFTLIELLVVVLIIGALAAVALPQYRKAVDRSRWTEMLLLERSISRAQEAYYLANSQYARDFHSLPVTFHSEDGQYFSHGDTTAAFRTGEGVPYLEVYRRKNLTSYEDIVLLTFYYASPKRVLRECRPAFNTTNTNWQDLCKYLMGPQAQVWSNGWVVIEE